MSSIVFSVENLSKRYQLGVIGTGTFRGDLQRWWAKLHGLPNPHLNNGEKGHFYFELTKIPVSKIDFDLIRERVKSGDYQISVHATKCLRSRQLAIADLEHAIIYGKIIRNLSVCYLRQCAYRQAHRLH